MRSPRCCSGAGARRSARKPGGAGRAMPFAAALALTALWALAVAGIEPRRRRRPRLAEAARDLGWLASPRCCCSCATRADVRGVGARRRLCGGRWRSRCVAALALAIDRALRAPPARRRRGRRGGCRLRAAGGAAARWCWSTTCRERAGARRAGGIARSSRWRWRRCGAVDLVALRAAGSPGAGRRR